ncbi:MAG: CoA pyrophosphatase [Pseudomonadota bacterium]|nr:CoA pyrophosphatase [Pseudomonadota bacterium]
MRSILCDQPLRVLIEQRLDQFSVRRANQEGLRQAAVAVVVTDVGPGADLPGIEDSRSWSDHAALILTRRAESLRKHSGQWAFPGGRVEPGETLIEAALREMRDEIGVDLPQSNVLGCLDDFVTRSGFAMTPVVVWGGNGLVTQADPSEVASVHRIPLSEFCRDDAPQLSYTDTSDHPVLRMPVGDDAIAAPTAALIYQFREVCLLDQPTRVAHFEQPEFAWR